ncbi:MAG: glutamate 5-kinase [Alphaproteobacteria bacterium]|nr:glutamate 5-kinase [Alphaproteobacteria bacterium]
MSKHPTLAGARRIVIKIGSSLIARNARVRAGWLAALATDIAALQATGKDIIIVSSGAVALGRPQVGLGMGALSMDEKQAAAAAGQPLLIRAWQRAFTRHGIQVAQLLLTLDDSENRRRYLNARATCTTLLAHRLIPIINENDSVATAELKFGDNDRLAARVAVMLGADTLVLFSDVDGLYDKNPRTHGDARHIPVVTALTPDILAMAKGAASALSNGGMKTKLEAAQMATASGCRMVIADGTAPHALAGLLAGGRATWFTAAIKPQLARKHWIASSVELRGSVTVDAGAVRALGQGRSLLPAGVCAVDGNFKRGDMVAVKAPDGRLIGKGITAYDAAETKKICGKKSDAIAAILGYAHRDTLIHRDDLAML